MLCGDLNGHIPAEPSHITGGTGGDGRPSQVSDMAQSLPRHCCAVQFAPTEQEKRTERTLVSNARDLFLQLHLIIHNSL